MGFVESKDNRERDGGHEVGGRNLLFGLWDVSFAQRCILITLYAPMERGALTSLCILRQSVRGRHIEDYVLKVGSSRCANG